MSYAQLEKTLFNIKFTAKQLDKNSKKAEKERLQEVTRLKGAMAKGDNERARIYAENAIRKQKESINYVRLAARMEAVATRLDTAIKVRQVSQSMGMMVRGMDRALQSMNPEVISKIMAQFESQFDTVDVTSGYMSEAVSSSVAMSTPGEEVDSLMAQVADANGIELKHALGTGYRPPVGETKTEAESAETELEKRLASLMKN